MISKEEYDKEITVETSSGGIIITGINAGYCFSVIKGKKVINKLFRYNKFSESPYFCINYHIFNGSDDVKIYDQKMKDSINGNIDV